MISEEQEEKFRVFVEKFSHRIRFTDRTRIDVMLGNIYRQPNIDLAMNELIKFIAAARSEKMVEPLDLYYCKQELLEICPEKYGTLTDIFNRAAIMKEQDIIENKNDKYGDIVQFHDCMTDFGNMMEGSGMEYYFAEGLVGFLSADNLAPQEQNKDLVNCVRAENEDSTEKDTRVENNFNGESTKKINSDLER